MTSVDEITTVTAVNQMYDSDIRINWARSDVESRNVSGPIEHIKMAYESKLLKGIIFSSASDSEDPYDLWKDTHMPQNKVLNIHHYAGDSLLTIAQIEKSIQQCDCKSSALLMEKYLSVLIRHQ